ncbi:DUF742 domain-containing protein [Actinophytocola sp.]|uniref:DUF742 domain-containing protein n=1 Tax=Actinophytocola sp. TaxID=1872138 RepID=UPI002D4BEF8B|nr:DUF742 domain-containing protein [Actinophytocola sp.]HYQ67917.1 DUF742 domain-containing protein [Actinophytocola sp.]
MTDEDGFAEVLNGLALGGGKHKRHKEQDARHDEEPDPRADWSWAGPFSSAGVTPAGTADEDLSDASIVRPYAWTGGRTKSTVDFEIETMVSTSEHGERIEALRQTEHRSIAGLCAEPRSVAEVATLLSVPLGVAKVLLGDMSKLGLVIVHRTAAVGDDKAHLMLMERVLSGLRRL